MAHDLQFLRAFSRAARKIPGGGRLSELLRRRYANHEREILLEDFDGAGKFQVNLSDHIGGQIFWHGHYSSDVLKLAAKLLRPTDIVFDVGANIGEFSVFAARRVPAGQLHAFEPMNKLWQRARQNCELNGFRNAQVHNVGLGGEAGSVPIYKASAPGIDGAVNNGMNSLFVGSGFEVAENIEIVTLDAWCADHQIGRLDLMKIDVEGAELAVLRGGSASIKRFRPKMIIEVNPRTCERAGYSPRDLLDYIAGLGYAISNIETGGRTSTPSDLDSVTRDVLCSPASS